MVYLFSFGFGLAFVALAIIKGIIAAEKKQPVITAFRVTLAFIGAAIIGQSAYTGPMYNVWKRQLDGRAELAQAEWNRKIVIEEAKAKEESAKSWAAAEVIRAEGSNSANEIMKKSLGGNENYLRWLWIEKMDGLNGQVIYLPSDGGLPIMEAAKRK